MNNPNIPVQSLKILVISMFSAVFLAILILVTVVGPAEFGIDPTGLGKAMGLTVLAKPLQSQTITTISCPSGEQLENWQDIVVIIVPADSGLEYKFLVKKNNNLEYTWITDGEKLYYDFHAEPAGDTSGYFKSFKEATDHQSNGALSAPFTGSYGWYWKNNTQFPVQITLKVKGEYTVKGLM